MNIANSMITNVAGPGFVSPALASRKRYPFVFVIDVSGSTGSLPDPDIDHINKAIAILLDTLRNPVPSSELQKQVDSIDICMIAYSASPVVILPWSTVQNLPAALPPLTPQSCTGTGAAMQAALAQIGDRLRYYNDPANQFAHGMPHIIHLTDGAMNDMVPGDPLWNSIKSQINALDGSTDPEKRRITMLHFLSPKGCDKARIQVGNNLYTGQQLLAQLSGKDTVFEMGKEVSSFETLIQLITVVITKITQNFGGVASTRTTLDSAAAAHVTTPAGMPITQPA